EDRRLRLAVAGDDGERLAEVEELAVEVEEADGAFLRAPVAEGRLAAIQPFARLLDEQAEESVRQLAVLLAVELDGRACRVEGGGAVDVCHGGGRGLSVRAQPVGAHG